MSSFYSFPRLTFSFLILWPSGSIAKPRYFQQLRVVLISRTARCVTCHSEEDGKGLNTYGRRLAALSKDDSLADRIALLDTDPPADASDEEKRQRLLDQDIDGDGVPNWVEILAGASPADAKDRPGKKKIQRIQRVIHCKLCHLDNNLPGKEGLEANPHNELGELLARTYVVPRRRKRPKRASAIRAAAERTSILTRLVKIKKKRPRRSKATYWQKIRLLHDPTNPQDNPSIKRWRRFKKTAAKQRSNRKRDHTIGIQCDAHPLDGFLLDAKGLE